MRYRTPLGWVAHIATLTVDATQPSLLDNPPQRILHGTTLCGITSDLHPLPTTTRWPTCRNCRRAAHRYLSLARQDATA